jgi:hypothetical protein
MFHRRRSRGFQQRQVSYESEASSRGHCAIGAAGGRSLGRIVHYVLRHLRRVSLVQHAVSVRGKRTMLLLGSAFLLVISIASFLLVLGLLTLQVWLKAIICLCEGQFIRCGFWLCLGILPVNLFFGSGESYTPLYITIMVLALAAATGKFLLWWQQRRADAAPGGATLPPHSPELITLHVRVVDDDGLSGAIAPPVAAHRPRRRPGHVFHYRPTRPR